jgi:hypothetical protein
MDNFSPEGTAKRYFKAQGHTQGCRVTSNPTGVLNSTSMKTSKLALYDLPLPYSIYCNYFITS